jgi:hypothetical protein
VSAGPLRRGVFVAPFDELSDPRELARLTARAERRGWDGVFLWDHVAYDAPVQRIADAWVALAAMAVATEAVLLGPLVTPLARRHPLKLRREVETLSELSGGRLVLGAGLGGTREAELPDYDERDDLRARARLLDERLEQVAGDRLVPVWIGARWPNRRPLARAARWDGVFPIDLPGPDAVREVAAAVGEGHEVVVEGGPGTDWAPWHDAGATWALTGWDSQPRLAEVTAAIEAGP